MERTNEGGTNMKEMKFSSQICTTREQGMQLLELGLNPETADMVWHHNKRSKLREWELRPHRPTLRSTTIWDIQKLNVFNYKDEEGKVMTGEEFFDELYSKDVPAWSLHRLMEICNLYMCQVIVDNAYEDMIYLVDDCIKNNRIPKQYLME